MAGLYLASVLYVVKPTKGPWFGILDGIIGCCKMSLKIWRNKENGALPPKSKCAVHIGPFPASEAHLGSD